MHHCVEFELCTCTASIKGIVLEPPSSPPCLLKISPMAFSHCAISLTFENEGPSVELQ